MKFILFCISGAIFRDDMKAFALIVLKTNQKGH